MPRFFQSDSSLNDEDDDDRYVSTPAENHLEDDDSINFVREDDDSVNSSDLEDCMVTYEQRKRLSSQGHLDHHDYFNTDIFSDNESDDGENDSVKENDACLLDISGSDSLCDHRHYYQSLYEDVEIGTNETHELYTTSKGFPGSLRGTSAMFPQQPKQALSLTRLVLHARDDIAATFKDPKKFKEQYERRKYSIAQQFLENYGGDPSEILESSYNIESESNPATEETQPSSQGSVTGELESEEATDCNVSKTKAGKTKRQKQGTQLNEKVHFRCCAHGIVWTFLAISAGIIGTYASMSSHRSSSFVNLAKPMFVAPIYDDVQGIGLFRMEVCYNDRFAERTGCEAYELSANDIDDSMYEISRVLASLAMLFGGFLTSILVTSICWESMNVKPIGFGYLVSYFFQSFTMLFFDTEICSEFECRIGTGCALCIGAAFCWLVACVAVSRMDNFKVRAIRRRKYLARLARRHEREVRRRKTQLIKKLSLPKSSMALLNNSKKDLTMSPRSTDTSRATSRNRYEC